MAKILAIKFGFVPDWKWPPFQMHFIEGNILIQVHLIKISLKFVLKGPTDKKSALVQVMVWYETVGEQLNQWWHKSMII